MRTSRGLGDAVLSNPPAGVTVYPTLLLNLNTGLSENKNLILVGNPPNAIYKDIANGNAIVSNVQMAKQLAVPQGASTWYDPSQPLAAGMTASGAATPPVGAGAGSGSGSALVPPTGSSLLNSAMAWVSANPLLAAGAVVALMLVIGGRK